MEKFSTWRDKATGISPFVPLKEPRSSWLVKFIKLLIVVLKIPFFFASILLYQILPFNFILKFILLFLFSLNNLQLLADGIKASNIDKINSQKPKKGDLVFTNYISPLDGFIFKLISNSPIIIIIPYNNQLFSYSPISLFFHSFSGKLGNNINVIPTNKIIFFLFESTPSNNKGLLPFIPLNYNFSKFNIRSMVMKINPPHYTLPIPYLSYSAYLFSLLSNFNIKSNFFKVKFYTFDSFNKNLIIKSFDQNQLISVQLTLDDKLAFWNYYKKIKND